MRSARVLNSPWVDDKRRGPVVLALPRDRFESSWWAMFVIELIYKVDLAEIDAHMAAHVKFLKKYYAAGHFLVSGRKIPRDGGIILAVGQDPAGDRSHRPGGSVLSSAVSPTSESSSFAPASAPTTFSSA